MPINQSTINAVKRLGEIAEEKKDVRIINVLDKIKKFGIIVYFNDYIDKWCYMMSEKPDKLSDAELVDVIIDFSTRLELEVITIHGFRAFAVYGTCLADVMEELHHWLDKKIRLAEEMEKSERKDASGWLASKYNPVNLDSRVTVIAVKETGTEKPEYVYYRFNMERIIEHYSCELHPCNFYKLMSELKIV